MQVKTPKEFFEKVLPDKFDASKAINIDCVVQMKITGDEGGEWNIIVKDRKIEVHEGKHSSPTITVEMRDTDYVDLVNGKLSGERAFMMGKLKFKGNLSTAMKMRGLGII